MLLDPRMYPSSASMAGSTPIVMVKHFRVTTDLPSQSGATTSVNNFTSPGVLPGDIVAASPPNLTNCAFGGARVSAADVIEIEISNPGSSNNPAEGTWEIMVFRAA